MIHITFLLAACLLVTPLHGASHPHRVIGRGGAPALPVVLPVRMQGVTGQVQPQVGSGGRAGVPVPHGPAHGVPLGMPAHTGGASSHPSTAAAAATAALPQESTPIPPLQVHINAFSISPSDLFKDYLPQFYSERKLFMLSDIPSRDLMNPRSPQIHVAQYEDIPRPDVLQGPRKHVQCVRGPYTYQDTREQVHWYVNFGDQNLFYFAKDDVLAQSELQVAEIPALAALREFAASTGSILPRLSVIRRIQHRTVDRARMPTPVTAMNVQRHLAIDSRDIYGAKFAQASVEEIGRFVQVVSPPTLTNVVAIVAPQGSAAGTPYTLTDISYAFHTAYAGFLQARMETIKHTRKDNVVVHTGNWGCGAYGGNAQMMALVQILAARAAGVDLVVHALRKEATWMAALPIADTLWPTTPSTTNTMRLIADIAKLGYMWVNPGVFLQQGIHELIQGEYTPTEIVRANGAVDKTIDRIFDAYMPNYRDNKKMAVFNQIKPRLTQPGNHRMYVAQYQAVPFPVRLGTMAPAMRIVYAKGIYNYHRHADPLVTTVYVNFGQPHLFGAYDHSFVQDEIQAYEIPALAALRDEVDAEYAQRRRNPNQPVIHPELVKFRLTGVMKPRPLTIFDVERHLAVNTRKIYGQDAVDSASDAEFRSAVAVLSPPQKANVLVLVAPKRGLTQRGATYDAITVNNILHMAYAGFLQARNEAILFSRVKSQPEPKLVQIHTGNWGCGAYGGNVILMALMQMVAARATGVQLKAYPLQSQADWSVAERLLEKMVWPSKELQVDTAELVKRVLRLGLTWQN